MALEKEDAKLIAEQLAKLQKQSSPASSAPSSSGIKDFDAATIKATSELNPFGSALKTAGSTAAAGLKTLQSAVEDGMDTWRNLSKSGLSFNNDIIGMTTAAAGTRLPLKDFADVVKNNATDLAGLGGSVTRGAEAFAKMSKGFFESGATDSLKQLGYTNKELNEILALQAISVRGIVKDEGERNRVAYESASKLATEMDAMAKLTGKSREEQQEILKKQQTDMQFDAAVRLKARQIDDPVKRAEFEANARTQLMQAEREGRGQMFKEYFAFGNVITKEAGQQSALMQEQAAATRKAAMASANTQLESADREARANEAQNEARMAAVRDANDVSKLQLRQLGAVGGPVSDTLNKQALVMNTYTQALEKVAKENELDLNNKADLKKAQELATAEVKKAAAGQNDAGKQVDGSTKAMVQFGNTVDHVRAGLITGLLTPVRDTIGPELGRLGENLKKANSNFQGQGQIGAAVEKAASSGVRAGEQPTGDRRQAPVEEGGVLGAVKGAGSVVGMGAQGARAGLRKLNETIEKRATGGPVEANEPYIVGDGGEEELFVPKAAGDIIPKSKIASIFADRQQDMLGQLKTEMPGINVGSISKNISTSISGLSESTKGPNLKELTKPFESAFSNFGSKFSSVTNSVAEKFNQSKLADTFSNFGTDIEKSVLKVVGDVKETKFSESFDEFGDNFNDVISKMSTDISDAVPLDITREIAQLKIDDARKESEEAKAEVEKLLNDSNASDDELNSAYERYKEKYDNLNKVVEESMGDLTGSFDDFSSGWEDSVEKISTDISDALPVDEFDGLDEAIEEQKRIQQNTSGMDVLAEDGSVAQGMKINPETGETYSMSDVIAGSSPTLAQSNRKISLDSFTLSKSGMPIAKPKSVAAATPDKKPEEKKASPGKAINPETGEEYTPVSSGTAASDKPKGDTKTPGAGSGESKAATLDDVVKSLSALNSKVSQLITTSESGYQAVAKAAKSNSSNLYTR